MKRVLLTVAVALLIPGMVGAANPTLGVYFTGTTWHDPAAPFTQFQAQLVIVQSEYYVTGVEYQLITPSDPAHSQFFIQSYTLPEGSLEIGGPFAGHAITFWPPLTGYPEGYDVCATYTCMTTVTCPEMLDYQLVIGPHPGSGELRGSYSPDNELFPIDGLTSYLCLDQIGVEEESWGAIKSMYR